MFLKTYCVRSKQKVLTKMLLISKITSILILATCLNASAKLNPGTLNPPIEIHGRVINKEGDPLQGVSVLIAGTQNGTTTNSDGRFTLTVPNANTSLEVSSVGFQTRRVNVGNQTEITITLENNIAGLSSVVVVGYGTQSKRNVTSSISSVTSKDIANYPVQQIGQALEGKVSGVQIIQNSGAPGSSLRFRIRGNGTVNNSDPLYVVDGNLGADPDDLDPNNIESIEVLKSASAAAIYGAQGANGVVLITTKKGVSGVPVLQVGFSTGFQKVHREMPMMNATQFATIYNTALTNGGQQPLFTDIGSLGKGTNWQDAIFRTAPVQNARFSMSGGSEQGTYYISADYFSQEGIVLNTDYDRLNFRVNSEYKLNKTFSFGENLGLSYSVRNTIPEFGGRNPVPNSWNMDPSAPVKNSDGSWGFPKFSDTKNPVAEATLTHHTIKRPALHSSAYFDIKPLNNNNLVYRSQINMNIGFSNVADFVPIFDIFPLQRNLVSTVTRSVDQWINWDWQNTLTFKLKKGSNNIEILGGTTMQTSHTEDVLASGIGLPASANIDPNLRYLSLVGVNGQSVNGGAGEYSILSFLGRINYSYKGTYLFTGNFRADGSSKFGRNNRFGYFPSFSIGWRISDENFMKNISFINDLKIRGGWGSLGNQNSLSNYTFANSLTSNLNYVYGQAISQGQALTSKGNPDLKWETTKETEIGFDFTGFESRITLSASYYNKKTSGMLLRVPIPAFTGIQQAPFLNGGDVLNKGFELSLGYHKTTSGTFTYDVSANLTHNMNKVTKLSNSNAAIISGGGYSQTVVGRPIASFYGYVADGIFQTPEEVNNHAVQSSAGTGPGDIRFKDLNDDGVINQFDRTFIGNPFPDFTYGLNGNFQWKQFDLSIALQGVYGNDIIGAWKYFTEGSNFYNYDLEMLKAWHGEGTSNKIPKVNVNDPNNNLRASSYFIENGSYLRLKHLQLGYTLPAGYINKIKNLHIYLSFENLLTLTKYPGFDPEIGGPGTTLDIGVDNGFYPQAKTITAGINISL